MFALQYVQYGPSDVMSVSTRDEPHARPGEVRIRVEATGVTPADWYLRSGRLKDFSPLQFPHVPGVDAAGIVDEIGDGVTGVSIGDAVFGLTPSADLGGGAAEYAVLAAWAAKPDVWSWAQAGGAAANIETATRVLDALGVTAGTVLLIEGAAGGVGSTAVQLAVARGATVIGTASERNHAFLAELGAKPVSYGPGLAGRVREAAPDGADLALDAAGSGSLPELVEIVGAPGRVVSIADFAAHEYGVALSTSAGPGASGVSGRAGLATAVELVSRGRFTVPVHATFALSEAGDAHDESATGHARGKIVITVP
jgi:NADPH:quinone reductase-like Zn-dependent oxidoreductase